MVFFILHQHFEFKFYYCSAMPLCGPNLPAVLLKRVRNGRFNSETAVRRWLVSGREWPLHKTAIIYGFVTVSIPKRLRYDRFASETATWIQKWLKMSAGTPRKLWI